jgi:hypothetical protein
MYSRHRFEGKTVVVQNIDDCTVIMSDSLSVETHKDDRDKFEYDVRPDSVHVSQTRASHNRVFLYLPSGSRLVVNASNVTIKGSLFDHEQRASYDVVLRDSKLLVSAAKLHTFFDRLKISGSGQNELIIDDFVHITDLDIENITGVNIAEGWQVGNLKTAFLSGSAMSKSGDSLSIRSR